MTALALAGTGGGAVLPDLVLPPGFDRVGDVVRFEQDSGPAVELSPTGHGDDAPGFHPVPAGEGQEPALSPPLKRGPYRCKACGEPGHNARTCLGGADGTADDAEASDDADPDCASARSLKPADKVPCTRCGLRGHVAGDPDRCLYYRGSLGMGGQSDQAGRAG